MSKRFLYSTGQWHKADVGNVLFIQIIGDPKENLLIPDVLQSDESLISFGVFINAQAMETEMHYKIIEEEY